jgi:hypothetical protein
MKKFTSISNKSSSISFNKANDKLLSTDISGLNNQLSTEIKNSKLDGEWEIVNIIDVSLEKPTNEAIIINAELGGKSVKRGDFLYVTALINKKGNTYHQSQMGVLKVRVTEIYNTLMILNNIK